nr:hypothetical protein [Psychrobacter sp. PraFG1]UNK06420.1 hypothetical protein MN210_07915 [Psychrobacter sp. PraFG1]
MTVKFTIKNFDELTAVDVYYILQARSQVFVVEQHCPYQDVDDIDFECLHLVAHMDKTLVGYCRIIPPNVGGVASIQIPASVECWCYLSTAAMGWRAIS